MGAGAGNPLRGPGHRCAVFSRDLLSLPHLAGLFPLGGQPARQGARVRGDGEEVPSKGLVGGLSGARIQAQVQPEFRLSVIAQVLAVCTAWAFAPGGWWDARHSTVPVGSAQFHPAELAGSPVWRVLLPTGTAAALAEADGEVGAGTVGPAGSREFEGRRME